MPDRYGYSFEGGPTGDRRAVLFELDTGAHLVTLSIEGRAWWVYADWYAEDGDCDPPPSGLADWIHEREALFVRHGFQVRRWSHLWPCSTCGASTWSPCRHLRTGARLKRGHRGRAPGVRRRAPRE